MTRTIWALALPAMATNLATALFGLADTWAIGQLGDSAAQGAVDLGARALISALTVFNFLRTATVALTARAVGADAQAPDAQTAAALWRALIVAGAIGAALLALVPWAAPRAPVWLGAGGRVADLAGRYIGLRGLAIPAALANMALTGWLIGQRHVRAVLGAEVAANVLHIALDLLLVLGFGMGVSGVALASVLSELARLLALALIARRVWHTLGPARMPIWAPAIRDARAFRALAAMNGDLMMRTLLLIVTMLAFTRQSAQGGVAVLAANGILMQWFLAAAMLLDGLETAAQVLCAQAQGAGDGAGLRHTLGWGLALGLALGALQGLAGARLIAAFTLDPAVRAAAGAALPWAMALPLIGASSFVLDGVFVGAGWTRGLLVTMAAAALVFQGALMLAAPLGHHGLWLAYALFLAARAGAQGLWLARQARQPARHAARAG
ncbi:MAG: MATE family efflux transporter [Novosphingobium aromaticivorans]|nr:MATE family efflux transporter [Novosphingobium aromaticivorans]